MSDVHAAIDIGTNSIHLVVAEVDSRGGFDVVTSEKETVRLGSGTGEMRELTAAAMDRGVGALQRFRQIADVHNATIHAVATSAVREADNGAVFLDRAAQEAGVQVDIISGNEEARLIHLGVLQALSVFEQQILVIDIGGGSTELVVGRAGRVLVARSLKLGHIRLTNRFFPDGRVDPGALQACRDHVRSFLAPAVTTFRGVGFQIAAGCSGTISTVAALTRAASPTTPAPSMLSSGGTGEIEASALAALVERLASFPDPESRVANTPGLEAKRADVIVAGAILLEQLFDRLGIETMTVSPFALREGVLLDRVHGEDGGVHHLSNIRRDSVIRFADAFEEDRSHVEHATDLALQLFDDLKEVHGYSVFERNLLEAAGLLHNVGLFVSHASHHKHSYYIIRNSDRLAGFTNHEIELIAQVARYHRRSGPKPTHDAFMRLDPADQTRVRMLAGVLRVAIALDRTRRRVVTRVHAVVNDRGVMVEVEVADGADTSLELYTARDRVALLGEAVGRPVEVSPRP